MNKRVVMVLGGEAAVEHGVDGRSRVQGGSEMVGVAEKV